MDEMYKFLTSVYKVVLTPVSWPSIMERILLGIHDVMTVDDTTSVGR